MVGGRGHLLVESVKEDTKAGGTLFKAITFDFWNTLYKGPGANDVTEKRIELVQKVLQEGGLSSDRRAITRAFKRCWQRAYFYQRINGLEITPRGHVECIKKELGLKLDPELDEKLYRAYTQALLKAPPELNDGARDVLQELKERYRLAVICNTGATPGLILRKLMAADGILGYFDLTVFSDEVTWAKPNIRIFRYTLQRLGVNPYEAVHVGDDTITDVIGAKRAGMKAVWIFPQANQPVPECDWHIRDLRELRQIFGKAVEFGGSEKCSRKFGVE
ncbi:MAG TPA: HAD family hydrolase [Syntrophothermus lipocalidus]|uniref:HAD family hydrolase n=1 Tax=Syntrophothermus lipocalidus TaxID=86170 RepID=UPI0006743FFA|nr:HAD family hydrolase [Syntrophothermus lipocalidus]HHV76065.1 HAD family hydrolase [Syntrophothermus lipocalidus]